jgi:hypothetical protein
VRFRLLFHDPGFFINDPTIEVMLDDQLLYTGGFRGGFDVSTEVAPGRHRLTTAIVVGGLARRRSFELDLDPAHGYRDAAIVEGVLEYSRFWGNFKKRLSLSTRAS